MLCIRVDHRNFPISVYSVYRENCVVDVSYILFFELLIRYIVGGHPDVQNNIILGRDRVPYRNFTLSTHSNNGVFFRYQNDKCTTHVHTQRVVFLICIVKIILNNNLGPFNGGSAVIS